MHFGNVACGNQFAFQYKASAFVFARYTVHFNRLLRLSQNLIVLRELAKPACPAGTRFFVWSP